MFESKSLIIFIFLVIVITFLFIYFIYKKVTKKEDNGRVATQEEIDFINKVCENYTHNVLFLLSKEGSVIARSLEEVFISDGNEIYVKIQIIVKDKKIILYCYFSGRNEMIYNKDKHIFYDFNLKEVARCLKLFDFEVNEKLLIKSEWLKSFAFY